MMRPNKDEYYLNIALAVSKRSTCNRRHYGCVIVKDDVIVSTGYNGSPRGELNCCEGDVCKRADAKRYEGYEHCPAVHAEQNALLSIDRSHSRGATVYLACETSIFNTWLEEESIKPCNLCKRMLINAGIERVVTRKGDIVWD